MKKKCWVIYILRCSDNSLYTGISKDISKRLLAHNSGKASRYTRCRRPVHIVYIQQNMSHSAALKREYQIKAMNKKQKENLIIKNSWSISRYSSLSWKLTIYQLRSFADPAFEVIYKLGNSNIHKGNFNVQVFNCNNFVIGFCFSISLGGWKTKR